jgi:hypothetical protein
MSAMANAFSRLLRQIVTIYIAIGIFFDGRCDLIRDSPNRNHRVHVRLVAIAPHKPAADVALILK